MKKTILILVVVLFACFMLGNSVQPVFASGNAKSGGNLMINLGRPAQIIGDPLRVFGVHSEYARIPLEGLFQYDPNERGKLIPMLATSWELASDKSHYTMKLRSGVKFHDGTDFNAQAVKWNLDRWLESKSPLLKDVNAIDVIDEHTIRINLSKWNNLMLYNFDNNTFIISPTAFEKNGEDWAGYNPVGTGPFKLVKFKRNVVLKFEKFKEYYKEGLPLLDSLDVSQIVDPMTAMACFKRGEIDAWMDVDAISASELSKEGKWQIETANGPVYFLNYNSVDPESPFFKQEVREALDYAIDRDRVAELSGRGFRKGVRTFFYGLDYKKAGTTIREYNPEKAKQLLKEAGYPDGFKVKLFFLSPAERDTAVAFQGYLKEVGIDVNVEGMAGAGWREKGLTPIKNGEMIYSFLPPSSSPLKAGNITFVKGAWVRLQRIKRPDGLDEILDQAFSEKDLDAGIKHLYKAEKLVYDYAMICPVIVRQGITIKAPYVKDAPSGYGFMPRFNLERAWLDK